MLRSLNIRRVVFVVGLALLIEGLFMLLALPFSFYYKSGDHWIILLSSLITVLSGGLFLFQGRGKEKKAMGRREGFLIVALTWMLMSAYGTLPFILSGVIPDFTSAFFESVSGFTTTGSSVLKDVEVVPHGVLFWRSTTHWIGGMGIIVFTVALLSFMGAGGSQLISAESSDPVKGKLLPRIREAAKILWGIYLIFTVVMTVLLLGGGMSLFDALCHTFGALGTGGFSTRNASMGAFNPFCQYVVIVFMVIGATNFAMHFFLLTGKFRNFIRDDEYKAYMGIIIISTLFIGGYLFVVNGYDVEKSFRSALFQVTSIMTTSGFATENYLLWATPLIMVLFLLTFIGGSSGSTTGGMKVVRILIVGKAIRTEFMRILHPSALLPIRLNGKVLKEDTLSGVFIFLFVYLGTFVLASMFLMITGVDFMTAIGSVATTLGCVGPGLGETGPAGNFSEIPQVSKWVLSYCMLVGRLEIFSVIIVFSPAFWKS